METTIKILHIDADYRIVYIMIHKGRLITSDVSLETALFRLKNEKFDLILSEPHHRAILTPQTGMDHLGTFIENNLKEPSFLN